jgi:protein-disulfide isomerase
MSITEEEKIPQTRSWWPTIVTLLVLIGIGFFIWRIVYYVELVKSGELADIRLEEKQEMSVSRLAAATAASSLGEVNFSLTNEPSLGSDTAPLTFVMFGDFGCPYSQQSAFTLRSLFYQYPEKIRLVYKDFPLIDLHPDAERAAEAANCAKAQGKFWDMFDRIYQNQSDLSRDALISHARALDLEIGRFISCLDSQTYKDEIATDYNEGLEAGVYGTPTFFIGGQMVKGAIPADFLRSLIEKIGQPES